MVKPLLQGNKEEALLKFATQLGEMDAATRGKTEDHRDLQDSLHPDLTKEIAAFHDRRVNVEKIVEQIASICQLMSPRQQKAR